MYHGSALENDRCASCRSSGAQLRIVEGRLYDATNDINDKKEKKKERCGDALDNRICDIDKLKKKQSLECSRETYAI